MMRKTSIYLPERLKAALAARAATTGRSEAELVRAGIELLLSQAPAEPAAPPMVPVPGRLVGVGVGPGDPDLLTMRAVAALRRADRIVAPASALDAVGRAEAIVRQALPGLHVERVAFSMSPSRPARERSLAEAASVVADHLDGGEEVAWVTLGDPLTYSTFAAVAERVRRRRPSTVVEQVPGIMAFQALAARTGTVIAEDRERISIRTALDHAEPCAELGDPEVTLVIYKGGRHLPEIAAEVSSWGRSAGAVAGELLGMPGERVGPLRGLAGGPASYLATVIVPAARKGDG